jgi:CubicO group peptidase (beta-lactamase class C family)
VHEVLELMETAPMPAVGVSVFDREKRLFHQVRGTADLSTGRPARPGDWWDLASLTKVLVTLPEVLALCDAGSLSLDVPLGRQWPRAAAFPVGTATVRQLLAHNAGLPDTIAFFRRLSGSAAIVDAALSTPLGYEPGGPAIYSDLGYLLLGELVTELTGRSLAEPAADRAGLRFAPLPGPAVATEQCPWRGRLMDGEVHDENAWAMGGRSGHAGAFGTLDGVASAAQAWFTDRVVSPGLHEQARRCQSTNPRGERFGLGWWLNATRDLGGPSAGPGSYGASGFVGDCVWFEPGHGYGVVILSNRIHPIRGDRSPCREWTHKLLSAVADELRQPASPAHQPRRHSWAATPLQG